MFATHQPRIEAHARTPEGFADVAVFVLLTIQEPLRRVPEYMERVQRGDDSPLWGIKRRGAEWIWNNGKRWAARCQLLAHHRHATDADLLLALTECPGLGLVKAGFVAQLAFGRVGCLDTHNLKRFNLKPDAFALRSKQTPQLKRRKAETYAAKCQELGGCAFLWDSWCEYVATSTRIEWPGGAFEVSAYHCRALSLPEE